MNRCIHLFVTFSLGTFVLGVLGFTASELRSAELSLAGAWEVSLSEPRDPHAPWQTISLPGTLDDVGIGEPLSLKPELSLRVLTRLQRKHMFVGPAWYRRDVTIPADWAGRRIFLELERVLWESRVFVDGREVSRADSLTTPHRHDVSSALTPGHHQLILQIDNREIYRDVSLHIERYEVPASFPAAHAYTNHTQVMWNGALGYLRLRTEDRVAIERVAIYPHLGTAPRIEVVATCSNPNSQPVARAIALTLRQATQTPTDAATPTLADFHQVCEIPAGGGEVRLQWTLPSAVSIDTWDEFSPQLYELDASLADRAATADSAVSTRFGFREIAARDGEFLLNGHRIFFRGNLECAMYPLTGYPPTDLPSWRKLFGQAKTWGLNHLRFHSWCPPDAAFTAADELGVYVQIELPEWSLAVGKNPTTWQFIQSEADRIVAEYGNHPSFLLLSMGNELEGDFEQLDALVRRLRANDPRRLHTATTFTFQSGHGKAPEPADEYLITQYTTEGWIRGQGIFNDLPPAFDGDYHAALGKISVPVISHEIGQYAIYPDLNEIERYTGNLVPLNLIAVRDDLSRKNLLALAPKFTAASGRFAALLYKEEIERALRTPQLDGFQLLELQDFPGQGTALVGLLNAFWESKGILTPEEFREACSPLTPLARFPKAVYERGEVFRAKVEIANFLHDLPNAEIVWILRDTEHRTLASGVFGPLTLSCGGDHAVGEITMQIPVEGDAAQWQLEVLVRGTPYHNHWNLWIYPQGVLPVPKSVRWVTTLAEAQQFLAAGERVLFAPPIDRINGIEGKFVPVFWSPVHFPKQPGTMGILCDLTHPALRSFPTEFYSDWQWWDPVLHSRSVILDGLAATPIVRVIDNFTRNHSLANVFEAKVGNGRLLFCAVDIATDLDHRPAARQLRRSLLQYAASGDFEPQGQLAPEALNNFIAEKRP